MASVKKKEHLEAGKRRLEEFRKKKAVDRAKKSANHLHANVNENNNQPVPNKNEIHTDANGDLTSDSASESVAKPAQVVNDEKDSNSIQSNEVVSSNTHQNPFAPIENKEIDRYDGSWPSKVGSTKFSSSSYEKNDDFSASAGESGRHDDGFPHDQYGVLSMQVTKEYGGISSQPSYEQLNQAYPKAIDTDFTFANPGTANVSCDNPGTANVSCDNPGSIQPNKSSYGSLLDTDLTLSSNEDFAHSATKISGALFPQVSRNSHVAVEPSKSSISSVGDRKLNGYCGNLSTSNSTKVLPAGFQSSASTMGLYSSSYSPLSQSVAETNSRRLRPSFLESINLSRVEPGKDELFNPKVHNSSTFAKSLTENENLQSYSKPEAPYGASAFNRSTVASVPTGNGNDMYGGATFNNNVDIDKFFSSQKQDEDFAALEQHIEDLTQEKFSLQRALEASRTLADSLAAENSSLTDSYNQQGSIVNQLKLEMEMLQEEIKAHLVELEAVKMEYSNARLECIAADERASMLASEVISLEEKALKLRSSELKLEWLLENSQAELSSFKKKLSSLEKDRQDLQSTIDALREEKKLLQAKLRKTSASGNSFDAGKGLDNKKDVSTSTEDLRYEDETHAAADPSNETDNDFTPSILPESREFNLEFTSSRIPSDQLRMIKNINTLISELALEKEELVQALVLESTESSKLKELNKELSRKLEVQTQRLELLTAQSMANESIPLRQPDPRNMVMDNTPFADEGDEVVERVLGWIMKLFPGGPSRRRNGKQI